MPPPVRAADIVVPKPSAVNPAAPLATERSCAVPVCSVIAPVVALMVDGLPVPVIPSIVVSSEPTVAVARLTNVVPATGAGAVPV